MQGRQNTGAETSSWCRAAASRARRSARRSRRPAGRAPPPDAWRRSRSRRTRDSARRRRRARRGSCGRPGRSRAGRVRSVRAKPGFYRTRGGAIVRRADEHARRVVLAHEPRGHGRHAIGRPLLRLAVRRAGREPDQRARPDATPARASSAARRPALRADTATAAAGPSSHGDAEAADERAVVVRLMLNARARVRALRLRQQPAARRASA